MSGAESAAGHVQGTGGAGRAAKILAGSQQQQPGPGGVPADTPNGKAAKAEPLSLEELLKKKKAEQELAAKPKFLTKAERSRHRDEREKEKELELIRKQYLGDNKSKKKVVKASEKFRFNFDWDGKEDTSKDLNPLYNHLHQANLLYGRGMLAGIDRREQKKVAATVEADMLRKLRGAAGIVETSDMRAAAREREMRADKYDGFDMTTDVHWSEKPLSKMTERDWRIFREDFNISYKGNANTLPLRNWDEAGLPEPLRMAVDFVQYDKPSPIQMASIPLGLKQLDVIGVAETGSGKTAAFVIPMLCYIMRQPVMDESNYADGPYAVVLAPTRELAQQIEEETVKLAKYTDFKVTSVVGGQSIEEQGSKLRRGCEIVIATPGRLLDCIERHYCVLNQCNYVVLDEADRMIDLGFEPQVQAVLDAMPHATLKPEDESAELDQKRTYRTTYMFSATMPPAVERLARKYLRRPIVVNIGRAGMAGENVTQRVIMIKENEKAHRLSSELDMIHEKKVIVFVNTKRQCDNVYAHLEETGYHCTVLHGGRTQEQREVSIKGFKEDTFNVLIATDVAGRGIDVPDVALVINYDMPNNIEAYTHRIGRTGRAGRKGTAITFLTGGDSEVFYDLKRLLEESKAVVPPELARSEAAKQKPGSVSQKRDSIQYAKK
ncbi:pre-mRNA-splicing ATP-dependent RNA helicase [Scenedesmus sp. NREL 46B-D3]|nr:pre-mRNA-splicing ATP-dependent RNA helicase [Scenedesmus sp. NREL 46B-D3]